jgi:hypothetical protein
MNQAKHCKSEAAIGAGFGEEDVTREKALVIVVTDVLESSPDFRSHVPPLDNQHHIGRPLDLLDWALAATAEAVEFWLLACGRC